MGKFCYDYPRPAVSADCVLFGYDGQYLNVLLIERGKEPWKGRWAFPGGFLNMDETAEQCAIRELKEETGIGNIKLRQLGAFSGVDRDPRGRVISVVFYTVVKMEDADPVAGDDAAGARWFRTGDVPPLAFDHDLVLQTALERLRSDLMSENGINEFSPVKFSGDLTRKILSEVNQHLDQDGYPARQP